MKKFISAITLFFIAFSGISQGYIKPNNSYGTIMNRLRPDSTLLVPTGPIAPVGLTGLRSNNQRMGAIYVDSTGGKFYWFNPKTLTWSEAGSGGTIITYPYTTFKYLTGYGTFGNFYDSARAAISLTTTGTTGAATYSSATGILNVPNYAGSAVTTVGAFQNLGTANAASISGNNIYLHKISATTPGVLSTGTDTIPGAKRLNGILSALNNNNNNSAKIYLFDSSSLQSGIGGIFQSGGSYMQFHQAQHFGASAGQTGFRWRLGNYSTSISGVGLGQDLMRLTGDGFTLNVPFIGDLNLQNKITFPNGSSGGEMRVQLQDSSATKFGGIYSRTTTGSPGWNIIALSLIDRADLSLSNTRNRFDFGRGISANGASPGNTLYASLTLDYAAFNNRIETPTAIIGSTGSVHSSSALEISSTTLGFLPPRMTAVQAEAIVSPAEGLLVYVNSVSTPGATITTKGWWGFDGTNWVKLN